MQSNPCMCGIRWECCVKHIHLEIHIETGEGENSDLHQLQYGVVAFVQRKEANILSDMEHTMTGLVMMHYDQHCHDAFQYMYLLIC